MDPLDIHDFDDKLEPEAVVDARFMLRLPVVNLLSFWAIVLCGIWIQSVESTNSGATSPVEIMVMFVAMACLFVSVYGSVIGTIGAVAFLLEGKPGRGFVWFITSAPFIALYLLPLVMWGKY